MLAPIRPAAPIRAKYEARLLALIEEMHASIVHWVAVEWRRNTPETVIYGADEAPVKALQSAIRQLGRRWLGRFDELSENLASYFAKAVKDRSDRALMVDLRKGGFTVKFKMTKPMRDAYDAVRAENVGLIKSIAEQHLSQVETLVMQSVSQGRDLGALTKALQANYGVTRRRAALISRDQNNKATAVLQKTRHLELGITQAKWLHSAGGKHPRPEHVAFSGKVYQIAEGHDFGDGEGPVWPGTAINCFPHGEPISLETEIVALWRSTFDGPMIHIQVGADLLNGTPNHPILTSDGWRSLDAVNCGDYVVCMAVDHGRVVAIDEGDFEASIGDVFEAAAVRFGYDRRCSSGFDFYGDVTNGDVDQIILPAPDLAANILSGGTEDIGDFHLPESNVGPEPCRLSSVEHVSPADAPSRGTIGAPLSRGLPALSDRIGLRACAPKPVPEQYISDAACSVARLPQLCGDSSRSEPFVEQFDDFGREAFPTHLVVGDNAASAQVLADLVSVVAKSQGNIFYLGATRYELRRVINKGVRDFSGHVYTVQTVNGYYSVGGARVQAKNCRCVAVPIVPGFD